MSYQVLARRFRPQTFGSIIGQEHITKALAHAILLNRVPHAVMLCGPRGVGKTTSARVFARALNCVGRAVTEGIDVANTKDPVSLVEPCGECVNCSEIARGVSLAVWEVDGASNNSVDNVRDLIDSLRSVPPPGSRYKIYIIDEVHMLSVAAFNALLKSLEEPPPNTVFIFATTEPHKIPETVLSRCQRHDFRRLPIALMVQSLRQIAAQENVSIDDSVLEFLATKARGGMRDAQSMLDRLIAFSAGSVTLDTAARLLGVVDATFFARLSDAVLTSSVADCFALLDEAFSQSIDIRTFLGDFLRHFRNLLMVKLLAQDSNERSQSLLRELLELPQQDVQTLKNQVAEREAFDLQRLFDVAEQTVRNALVSAFPRYVVEAGVAKMAALPSLLPLGEVMAKLQQGGSAARPIPPQQTVAPSAPLVRSAASHAPVSPSSPLSHTSSHTSDSHLTMSAPPPPFPGDPYPVSDEPLQSLAGAISWEGFLSFLREGKAGMVLLAYLRRVSPKIFTNGRVVLEAASFDQSALSDAGMRQTLIENLKAFSGQEKWDVRIVLAETMPIGSLAVKEKEELQEKKRRLEKEAKNDPSVQAALSVFEGSSIERILTSVSDSDD